MPTAKMHADEVDIDPSLVGRLIAAQLPQWAELPIEPVPSAGTDNALYRLGDEMVVRLPRVHRAVAQVEREQEWLPRLAPLLPLAIPAPLAKGLPAEGYPWEWSVYRWLEGETAARERIADLGQAAIDLAHFIAALRRVDPSDGPPPGEHNSFRGVPLATRDASVRTAVASLRGEIDVNAVTAAWEAALRVPELQRPPAWLHGDIDSRNLLVDRGRLSAVIDFGCLAVGDPTCDLMVAWTLLSAETRDTFRAALSAEDATWARGRGWALSWALIALPYYLETNPVIVRDARRTIAEVLADS
jgi:aminoglycoside phosphotransferase (APT) family kinase protein